MMRFKPIMLSTVLAAALCGATQPADASRDAPPEDSAPEASTEATPEASASPAPDNASEAGEGSDSALDSAVVPTPDAPAPATGASARADKPAVPAKGLPPTREYFVGIWAEPGKSCETALDFKPDGTLIGPFPRWELSDTGELTMVGNRQKILLTVIDADTMQSRRSPTGPPRILKRCPR